MHFFIAGILASANTAENELHEVGISKLVIVTLAVGSESHSELGGRGD